MREREQIVSTLKEGDGSRVAETMRGLVALQGEKFHHLMASLKIAAK